MNFDVKIMNSRTLVHMALNKFTNLVNNHGANENGVILESVFDSSNNNNHRDYYKKIFHQIDSIKINLNEIEGSVKKYENEIQLTTLHKVTLDNYLGLLDSLMKTLFNSRVDLSVEFVSEVLTLQIEISKMFNLNSNEKVNSSIITKKILPKIIDLSFQLDDENHTALLTQFRADINTKIDRELDRYRESLNNKLNEVSNQYSESRSQLFNSAEEYRDKLNLYKENMEVEVDEYKTRMQMLYEDVESKRTNINEVLVAASDSLTLAEKVLERNSQAGMAAAFQARYDDLEKVMNNWFYAFFACLILIIVAGIVFVQSAFSSDIKTAVELISKVAVAFPLVWGAWFSAKQYSHISQLREDYAYKVAVAMTYHGYKDEAANVNKDMSGKLLDSIIAQFSDNPVRLYQNNNSASLIEAMLKNDKFSDLINSAKSGVNGSAK